MDVKLAGAALATVGALALGSTAIAGPPDTILEGSTSQGVKVKLTVAGSGEAAAFRIGKTEVSCAEGGTLDNGAGTYREFDTSVPGHFFDKTRSSSDNAGYHFKSKTTVRGRIGADDPGWSGRFRLVTKVLDHGERIDTCKLKTRWSAG